MSAHGSKKVILLALAANFGIALAKFVAFFLTRSSSMIAEAVHSLADTSNQFLLLVGIAKADKPADEQHPFGYKMESYFWSFVVAIMLFSLGGLFAVYEGIEKLHEIAEKQANGESVVMEHPLVAVGVLLFSIALEGYSWFVATSEMNRTRGKRSIAQYIKESKSTEIIVVWMEDTGALVGLCLALVGVSLSWLTGNPYFDAYGTFAIGALLIVIAVVVGRETKSLLIGEAASPETCAVLRGVVASFEPVQKLVTMRTLHLGEDQLLVAFKVQWPSTMMADEVSRQTNVLEGKIREAVPSVKYLYVEPDVFDEELAKTPGRTT